MIRNYLVDRFNGYQNVQDLLRTYTPVETYVLAVNQIFKVNNRTTGSRCEIYSKLTLKTPERRKWSRSRVFIVKFERISYLGLVFLSLTLSR